MKIRSILLISAASLFACSTSNAIITDVTYHDDGDGAVVCPLYTWAGGDTMNIYGDQYWGPGHILADITTDLPEDPTLTIASAIDNDTGFAWTSYVVDVFMNVNFTLSGVSVANPLGWIGTIAIAPHQVAPFTPLWTGEIVYSQNGGPVVNTIPFDPNNTLDFSYKVTFTGATHYSLTEQVTPIPEPGTFGLVVCGLLVAGFSAIKRR